MKRTSTRWVLMRTNMPGSSRPSAFFDLAAHGHLACAAIDGDVREQQLAGAGIAGLLDGHADRGVFAAGNPPFW